jgi:hypothetical protein
MKKMHDESAPLGELQRASCAVILDRRQLEGRVATALYELESTARAVRAAATAVHALLSDLTATSGPQELRLVAVGLQSNALQVAIGALSTRAMAERLATLAYLLDPGTR